jgi:hypothetical protein
MRFVRLAVLACGLALVGTSVAGAFTVPPISVINGTEGEVRLLWTEPVDPADVGKGCEVVLMRNNNESTREGTDLILQSGTSSMVAENVEHDTDPQTYVGQLTLGTTITVSVRLGPEGEFSGGADVVETTCPVTPPATPPVSVEPATTAAAAPVLVAPSFTG